ncbi:MAG: hypothetical protein NUV48_01735 [Peptococcaceae bacterium]|nr:hypothetical protein [Peptococcaceae bacterium]
MIKRWHMYSKIQVMKSEGFKQRKVAKLLQIHRNTVKKYWDMTPDEFQETILEPAKKSSLEQHKELIISWLRTYREITAAQIYDWLKPEFGDIFYQTLINHGYTATKRTGCSIEYAV